MSYVVKMDKVENISKKFGRGVAVARKAKGWSQPALAKKIKGGKQGTISSWETGRTNFPENRFTEFAKVLELSIDELLTLGDLKESSSTSDLESRVKKLEEKQETNNKPNGNIIHLDKIDPILRDHILLLQRFPDAKKGKELNSLAVKLAKIDPKVIDDFISQMRFRLFELEEAGRKAANDDQGD